MNKLKNKEYKNEEVLKSNVLTKFNSFRNRALLIIGLFTSLSGIAQFDSSKISFSQKDAEGLEIIPENKPILAPKDVNAQVQINVYQTIGTTQAELTRLIEQYIEPTRNEKGKKLFYDLVKKNGISLTSNSDTALLYNSWDEKQVLPAFLQMYKEMRSDEYFVTILDQIAKTEAIGQKLDFYETFTAIKLKETLSNREFQNYYDEKAMEKFLAEHPEINILAQDMFMEMVDLYKKGDFPELKGFIDAMNEEFRSDFECFNNTDEIPTYIVTTIVTIIFIAFFYNRYIYNQKSH